MNDVFAPVPARSRPHHASLRRLAALLLALAVIGGQGVRLVSAQLAVVHAVLFYSPTCGHCHYVITEVLPPLFEQYGDQLQIVGIDVTTTGGQALYQAALQRFAVPAEHRGVPALIIDQTVLVGSIDIPNQFPGLVAQYLAQGGVDWPDVPYLLEALWASEQTPEPTAESTAAATTEATAEAAATAEATAAANAPTSEPPAASADVIPLQPGAFPAETAAADDLLSRLRRDPAGNALALLLLVAMLAVIGRVIGRLRSDWNARAPLTNFAGDLRGWRGLAIAALCVVGLGVAAYLTHVETTHTAAICGPIGDCNTVQQSPYATLFGLLPIGLLGLIGYAALLVALAGVQWARGQLKRLAEAALFGMALFGTLFSCYLTFLEPFVIGATCAWCLTSALSMTLILLVLMEALPARAEPTGQTAQA